MNLNCQCTLPSTSAAAHTAQNWVSSVANVIACDAAIAPVQKASCVSIDVSFSNAVASDTHIAKSVLANVLPVFTITLSSVDEFFISTAQIWMSPHNTTLPLTSNNIGAASQSVYVVGEA